MEQNRWRPFLLLALGSLLGVGLGSRFPYPWLALGLMIVWFFLFGRWLKSRQAWVGLLILGSCLLFFMRWTVVDSSNRSYLDQRIEPAHLYLIEGTIASAPKIDGDRLTFDLDTSHIQHEHALVPLPDQERIRLTVRLHKREEQKAAEQLTRGSRMRANIHFLQPQTATNPGAFDYRKFLYQQQIHWIGEVAYFDQLDLVAVPKWSWMAVVDQLRQTLAKQIDRLYDPSDAGFIRGLLLGERDQIHPQMEEMYRALGIVHVLSVSGLHVSIFILLLFFLLKKIGMTREMGASWILLFLPVYVLLTGAEPPVVRAGIMGGLGLVAVICNRWKDVLSFLAIAFLIQLWLNPYLLFTASFQFTFLLTAALIVCVRPLSDPLPATWRWGKEAFVATWIAQLVSFPIAISFFYEFTFFSWLPNLLFVPLLSGLILPEAMFTLLVSFIQFDLGKGLAGLTTWMLKGIHQGMEWMLPIFLPIPTWRPPSAIWIVGYGLVCLYLWIAWIGDLRVRWVHRSVASGFFIGLLVWVYLSPAGWDKETKITFLDVGQGDATLIETEGGQTVLIDGGGTPGIRKESWQERMEPFDVGKKVVVPFLKYRGIRQIDTLILTHGDADHIGGLQAVVERLPVKQVIRNPLPPQSSLERALLAELNKQRVPIFHAPIGQQLPIEPGITWQFLHPEVADASSHTGSTNNHSVVVLFTIHRHQVMMTGDIEQAAEEALLEKWDLPTVDILKVAHHGSQTSTSERWLQEVSPKESVISVGRENRYGHPSTEVLQRLQKYETNIWRTDQHGAVMVSVYPDHYTIKTMLPRNKEVR